MSNHIGTIILVTKKGLLPGRIEISLIGLSEFVIYIYLPSP